MENDVKQNDDTKDVSEETESSPKGEAGVIKSLRVKVKALEEKVPALEEKLNKLITSLGDFSDEEEVETVSNTKKEPKKYKEARVI